jgi:hypothetical protein
MEAELVRSASRARDVVESYRQYGLTVTRWQSRLLASSVSIARIAASFPNGAGDVAGMQQGDVAGMQQGDVTGVQQADVTGVQQADVAGVRLADLAVALRDVARNGLRPERARLDQLSKDLESLARLRVPGYPRPEDVHHHGAGHSKRIGLMANPAVRAGASATSRFQVTAAGRPTAS